MSIIYMVHNIIYIYIYKYTVRSKTNTKYLFLGRRTHAMAAMGDESMEVTKIASSAEVVRITSSMEQLQTKLRAELVRGVALDAW